MNNPTGNEERTTIFGTHVENMDGGRTKVAFVDAATGDTVERVLMNDMIAETHELSDGTTAWLLQDCQVGSQTLNVRSIYDCAIDGAEQQDVADAWLEGISPTTESAGLTEDDVDFDSAVEEDVDFDEFDDSVPMTSSTDLDVALVAAEAVVDTVDAVVDAVTGDKPKAKKMTAAQKAAKARELLYAEAEKVQAKMNTDIASALVQGKRHKDFGAWNFKAGVLSVDVRIQDENGNITHEPMHDSEGNDRVRILVNPTLAGKNGHPSYGAVLNRAIGPNFQHIDHPDVFIPCINAVDDIEGVQWDAYSFNNGARAGLTIDLSAMATTARKDAAEGLTGYLNLDANAQRSFLAEENGGHRCGVTIINSHDGKSALSGYLTVMRTYCKNLAMRGANQQMFKVRHMAGSIAGFDVEQLASGMRKAFLESQQHLLSMAILRHLPVEMNTFDKLLTAFDRQGLITQPTVTTDISNVDKFKDKDGNDVKLTKAQIESISKITRGHAFRAVSNGWMNPDLDYVKCEDDSVGTMFHAAQCVTGYLTHKPVFANDKKVLTGNAEGVETFMKKSAKATNFFENIAESAVKTYLNHTGQDTLGIEDMADFAQYFAENPSALKVGFKNSRNAKNSTMTSIEEIPEYHTTWKHKVIVQNQ